ncbi:MAG: hypothetical protein E7620_05925 [Ruminococcaceae bacterium]|nr:hypothetical protein [Oscillospiraceae bacterium]
MSENVHQIRNALNGYNKEEVRMVLKNNEAELQQRAATIDSLQQQIAVLEAKLEAARTPEAVEAAEKIELYDKLMKKMDGEFRNLLGPAQARAKAIEMRATTDYEIRMDQARATADGIYELAADRIAAVVDENMNRMYNLLDEFIYSKTLAGRVEAFVRACDKVSLKVAAGIISAAKFSGKAYTTVTTAVQEKVEDVKTGVKAKVEAVQAKVETVKSKVESFKNRGAVEAVVEEPVVEETVEEECACCCDCAPVVEEAVAEEAVVEAVVAEEETVAEA